MTQKPRTSRKFLYTYNARTEELNEYRGIYKAAEILDIEPATIYYVIKKPDKFCKKLKCYIITTNRKLTREHALELFYKHIKELKLKY